MKIRPLGERVLIELVKEEEVSKGGIIIPDSAKENHKKEKLLQLEQVSWTKMVKLYHLMLKRVILY